MDDNLILNVDSYKASHFLQYPTGAEFVSSYIEARGGAYRESVFFGLQAFVKGYLTRPITSDNINEAEQFLEKHGLPFNRQGWEYILDRWGGKLPLKIEAIPEGTLVPVSNVLVQVRNTDPRCAWLTSYVETALLRAVWYPTTVATRSFRCRKIIEQAMLKTSDSLDGLAFKLHDFGARGCSSLESATIGGAAHLLSFGGTDTIGGILMLRKYYGADMPGFSIPAAEHSTITSWGRDGESSAYANMLDRFPGTVAVVSDSYDLYHSLSELWGRELRSRVANSGRTIMIRPDSGSPRDVVCTTIETLMERFGYRENTKGFRVLPECVRVMQGDGMSESSIREILVGLEDLGLSADNVSFGMGGELLQNLTRDTLDFAMKASAICIQGSWRDIYKAPTTDLAKSSKPGRLKLIKRGNEYLTCRLEERRDDMSLLELVFENGELVRDESFHGIRRRLHGAVSELERSFSAVP